MSVNLAKLFGKDGNSRNQRVVDELEIKQYTYYDHEAYCKYLEKAGLPQVSLQKFLSSEIQANKEFKAIGAAYIENARVSVISNEQGGAKLLIKNFKKNVENAVSRFDQNISRQYIEAFRQSISMLDIDGPPDIEFQSSYWMEPQYHSGGEDKPAYYSGKVTPTWYLKHGDKKIIL